MFDHYSTVDDNLEYPYLKFRDIAQARKKPRRLFVESATALVDSTVELKTFPITHEGLIQSFQEHFSEEFGLETMLIDLWKKDSVYFV